MGGVNPDGDDGFAASERLTYHRVAAADPNAIISAAATTSHGGIDIDLERKSKDIGRAGSGGLTYPRIAIPIVGIPST